MKQAQFVSYLASQPWDMDRIRARSVIADIANRMLADARGTAGPARSERPDEDVFGDPCPCMEIIGPVARIPICGVLSINVPDWIKQYGINLTDANDIAEEVDQALADPNVQMIVQDQDSPGGLSLAGDKLFCVFEAANRKKPVFTWVADGAECCSAAYNSASPSHAILAGPFAAALANIGSYMTIVDDTEFWAQMGLKFICLRSGEYKGIGEDGITPKQLEYLKSIVSDAGDSIRGHVRKYRTEAAEEDLQGQWFSGQEAAARGFAAGTAKNFSAAVAKFSKLL